MYAAIASKILLKPSLIIDDTENATFGQMLYKPFAGTILTPSCFTRTIRKDQVKFDGYMEIAYLHPKYFQPDKTIYDILGLTQKDRYVILRFVDWQAGHDPHFRVSQMHGTALSSAAACLPTQNLG